MPGYTHLQRAVVSSDRRCGGPASPRPSSTTPSARAQTRDWIDANPLGTAAGYGVDLPLDREGSTRALGFARMQVSPIDAQLSRGKFEIAGVDALAQAMLDLRRLAWDLSLFTTAGIRLRALPPQYTTGTSIMPNKRNPDLVELLRASYASVAAARSELEQLLSLPIGLPPRPAVHQGPAVPRLRATASTRLACCPTCCAAWPGTPTACAKAFDAGMYATDKAVELAVAGMPFRDAYRLAAVEPLPKAGADAQASLDARVSPGGAAALGWPR